MKEKLDTTMSVEISSLSQRSTTTPKLNAFQIKPKNDAPHYYSKLGSVY